MAAKIEPTDRQSAGAATGSDDKLNQQLSAILGDLQHVGLQPGPLEEVESAERGDFRPAIMSYPDHEASERKEVYDRLVAIENEMKKRGSRRFGRYLVAILIGVAATLAWQAYGESAKQIIATRAPELGWSPEAKQMIATSIQWIGWTKPLAGPEKQAPPVAQTAPAVPSIDPAQVHQMARDLATLRLTVEQLAAGQSKLEAADVEILEKITPAPPPPQPIAAPAKPTPVPPSSRAPIAQGSPNK